MTELDIVRSKTGSRPRMTISLRVLLASAFGGLVALSVGTVLALTIISSFSNTFTLLNQSAVDLLNGMERQIVSEGQQAVRAVTVVARMYGEDDQSPDLAVRRHAVLEAALRSAPSVEGVFVFAGDGSQPYTVSDSAFRFTDGRIGPPPESFSRADLDKLLDVDAARGSNTPVWGTPAALRDSSFHHVAMPIMQGDKQVAVAVATIGRRTVNRITSELARGSDATVFLLTDNGRVISHSSRPDLFVNTPYYPIAEFPDPVLQKLPEARTDDEFGSAADSGVEVLSSPDGRDGHVFMIKKLNNFSSLPLTLGVYFAKADIGSTIFRTFMAMIAGLAGLLVAVIAAALMGKRIARPLTQVAATANLFSNFRLEEINELPRSRVREIDHQAVALNKMRLAMEQFSRYVPRRLVARLMDAGDEANRPVERELTIMFTDLTAFTSYSERMDATAIARVLNNHFEMVTSQVEATDGTVDKFMGDGVMAFWGAPDADPEHARHAIVAAERIARALIEFNREREPGRPRPRMRIGIHTGRVVVGNIGGTSRQNYTIVGDPVNVAQRLEQLGKEIMSPEDDVVVLVSQATVTAAAYENHFVPVGTHLVRGREKPIGVNRLKLDMAAEAAVPDALPRTA